MLILTHFQSSVWENHFWRALKMFFDLCWSLSLQNYVKGVIHRQIIVFLLRALFYLSLRITQKLHLIFHWGNFHYTNSFHRCSCKSHSFRRYLGKYSENQQKLCVWWKLPYREIKKLFCAVSYCWRIGQYYLYS